VLQKQGNVQNRQLWRQFASSEVAAIQSRQRFLAECNDRVETIRQALHNPAERGTALRVLDYLPLEERQCLLDDLVDLASVGHSDLELCRQAILSLPRPWLRVNLEKSAEPLLQAGTEEEYRRLLELYVELDWSLTQQLARRATQHCDPDIQEAGEDFLTYLNQRRFATAV